MREKYLNYKVLKYFFLPEKIPYTTTNDLKTSNNGNHRLPMHEGEFEIQNRLDPRKSQQDIQDLNTCS